MVSFQTAYRKKRRYVEIRTQIASQESFVEKAGIWMASDLLLTKEEPIEVPSISLLHFLAMRVVLS